MECRVVVLASLHYVNVPNYFIISIQQKSAIRRKLVLGISDSTAHNVMPYNAPKPILSSLLGTTRAYRNVVGMGKLNSVILFRFKFHFYI